MKPPNTAVRNAAAWQVQSLLLAYPDQRLPDRLTLARRVAATQPRAVADPLEAFAEHAGRTAPGDLAADYVATFDHRRRCCPYLTYYAHGDTRKRGVALLRLKQAYARAGWRLGDDENPPPTARRPDLAPPAPTPRAPPRH
ncbi:nitrate reductase molybdenum cofactor assembly chaperone, partial [Streptomyces sp. NPDC002491]